MKALRVFASSWLRCRRSISIVLRSALLLIAGLAFSACQASDSPDAAPRPAETASSSTRVVRILGRNSTALLALDRLGRGQPPPDTRLEITGRDSGRQVVDDLLSARAAGRQPYHSAVVPHRFLGELVEGGLVAPLDDGVLQGLGESDFFDGWWRATCWYRGTQYGLPSPRDPCRCGSAATSGMKRMRTRFTPGTASPPRPRGRGPNSSGWSNFSIVRQPAASAPSLSALQTKDSSSLAAVRV